MTGFLESEEALHAAARDACGLEDFGDDAYLEGLRALLESLDGDAALNPVGELTLRGSIVEALEGRLFSEHGWALHPECADAPIEQPLVIVGLPRTGTSAASRSRMRSTRAVTPAACCGPTSSTRSRSLR